MKKPKPYLIVDNSKRGKPPDKDDEKDRFYQWKAHATIGIVVIIVVLSLIIYDLWDSG